MGLFRRRDPYLGRRHSKGNLISNYLTSIGRAIAGVVTAGVVSGLLYFGYFNNNGAPSQHGILRISRASSSSATAQPEPYRCSRVSPPLMEYKIRDGDTVYGIIGAEGLDGQNLVNVAGLLRNENPNIGPNFELNAGDVINAPDMNCDGKVGASNPSAGEPIAIK